MPRDRPTKQARTHGALLDGDAAGRLDTLPTQAASDETNEADRARSDTPAELGRRTAPIELLWDLVFAVAVTRVTALLASQLSWAGFGRSMLALALIWWGWSAFAWVTNAEDPNGTSFRIVLLLATILIFISGVALPNAFGSDATIFAVSYSCVRFLHLALYAHAARRGHASAAAIAGFAVTVTIGMALLIAGALAGGSTQIVLWSAAVAIDYMGPAWLTRDRLRGLQRVAVAHFAERYALFILICLGESVVAIGLGASAEQLTAGSIAAIALTLVTTIELWWIYFGRSAAVAEARLRSHHDPVLAAADGYSYLHLLLVAGIIILAVGERYAVAHFDQPLPTPVRLVLYGGASLYLVGHVAFRARMLGTVDRAQLVAAAICAALAAPAAGIPGWAAAALLAAVIASLVVWQSAREEPPTGPTWASPISVFNLEHELGTAVS